MPTGEDAHGSDYFTPVFLLPQLCNSTQPDNPPTVSFLRTNKGEFQMYGEESMAGTVAADCGFARPEAQQFTDQAGKDHSPELIAEADADWLFYGVQDGAESPEDTSLWPSLEAVKNDRAIAIDYDSWYMNASLVSAGIILDGLKSYVLEAAPAP